MCHVPKLFYDVLNRLSTVTDTLNSAVLASYGYDDNGNRSTLTYNSSGISTSYGYNDANMLDDITNSKTGSTLSKYDYTYYLNGNQESKIDTVNGSVYYDYDGLGRLTSEGDNSTNGLSYAYDDFSNRHTMTATGTGAFATTYAYDKNNRLMNESKQAGSIIDTTRYFYDNNGNITCKAKEQLKPQGSETASLSVYAVPTLDNNDASAMLDTTNSPVSFYTYDGFNQLTSAIESDKRIKYSYNGDGLRASKNIGGTVTNYIWDGTNTVAETNGTGAVTAKYLRGINLIAADIGTNARQYYLYNGHGDVVQLGNASGAITKNYDYDAFGNEVNPVANDTNPFRFSGYYFDSETGTYYLRTRNYDPSVGRFISEDSVKGNANDPLSLNLYTYCHNDPINFSDPTGHIRQPGYVNGLWCQDPDAYEFGYGSVTYKSLVTLGQSWLKTPLEKRKDAENLANEVRTISRDLQSNGKSIMKLGAPKNIPFGGDLNDTERILYEGHPFQGLMMITDGGVAGSAAGISFVDGRLDNTNGNAFKHTYWNALMTLDMGANAKTWADAHEYGAKGNIGTIESQMDLYNNEIGRQIGNTKTVVTAQDIGNLVSSGMLKRIVNKSLVPTDSSSFLIKFPW